jgi:hypothetical protein
MVCISVFLVNRYLINIQHQGIYVLRAQVRYCLLKKYIRTAKSSPEIKLKKCKVYYRSHTYYVFDTSKSNWDLGQFNCMQL